MTRHRSVPTARAKRVARLLLIPVALVCVLIFGPSLSSAGEAPESPRASPAPASRVTLQAPAPGPLPIARTERALTPTGTRAILLGEINPRGHATRFKFQYGMTRPYAHTSGVGEREVVGQVTDEVAEGISQLELGATYHYRIIAFNKYGFVTGKDRTFRTLKRNARTAG
jgi:hypothetical protein